MNRRVLFAVVLSFIFLLSFLGTSSTSYQKEAYAIQDKGGNNRILSQYTPHSPIVISSDAEFDSQGWPGNGSQSNPYVIDGFSFSNNEISISITSTSVHFVISDCLFTSDDSSSGEGIRLTNVDNGNITVCNVSTLSTGIYASTCENLVIESNNITDIRIRSFDIRYCSDIVINDNQLYSGDFYTSHCTSSNFTANRLPSFYLSDADSCRMTDNLFSDGRFESLYVSGSQNILVENNTFENEYYPMTFSMSWNYTLRGNIFEKVGLTIDASITEWASIILEDNFVDNLPIVVMLNRTDEIIDLTSMGQLILVNSNRCVIQNGFFNGRGIAISLWYCEDASIEKIEGENIASALVVLNQCTGCSVSEVNLQTSINSGIRVRDSSQCIVEDNYCDDCSEGISLVRCSGINILSNVFSNNAVGILNSNVNGSLFYNNSIHGNSYGFSVQGLHNCVINDNEFTTNRLGISGYNIVNCTFTNNLVSRSSDIGFDIKTGCENNRFYNNTFHSNEDGNAIDNGFNNIWDDGIDTGNQWDDYSGTGVYEIPGTAGSVDRYPKSYTSATSSTTGTQNGFFSPEMIIILVSVIGITLVVAIVIVRKRLK